jgi:hypothetical protein
VEQILKTKNKGIKLATEDEVKRFVMDQPGVKRFEQIVAKNIYDNRWRVNVMYLRQNDQGVTERHIGQSFFIVWDSKQPTIKSDAEVKDKKDS